MAKHLLMTPFGPVDTSFSWMGTDPVLPAGASPSRPRRRRGRHAAVVSPSPYAGVPTLAVPPPPVRSRARGLSPYPEGGPVSPPYGVSLSAGPTAPPAPSPARGISPYPEGGPVSPPYGTTLVPDPVPADASTARQGPHATSHGSQTTTTTGGDRTPAAAPAPGPAPERATEQAPERATAAPARLPVRPRPSPERIRYRRPPADRPDMDILRRVLAALYRL